MKTRVIVLNDYVKKIPRANSTTYTKLMPNHNIRLY